MQPDTADDEPAELSFESFGAQRPDCPSVAAVAAVIQDVVTSQRLKIEALEDTIASVFVNLRSAPENELAWFFPKPHKDYRPLHALNACRLGMHFGLASRMDESRVVQLGIIGMFYDIGMWTPETPDVSVIRDLTRDEMTAVEGAAMRGADLLSKVADIDPLCALVAAQHHERADGTGYPNRTKAADQHPYSRLFQIIDSFLGMVEPRAFRKALNPVEAMQRLAVQAHRGYFHEPTFRDWLKVAGIFPVGSFVKLNTGELALVAKSGGDRTRTPTVQVLADELLDFRLRPMELDLATDTSFQVDGAFIQFPKVK